MGKTYYLIDSYPVNPVYGDIISKYSLEKYCIYVNGKWQPDFVGFVLREDATIISFPKHYSNIKEINDRDIKLLSKLMIKTRYISGLDDDLGEYDNFPLMAYINICSYYLKHGLYHETIKKRENSYMGKIDWNNTIRRSNKVISNNNLIFLPFIVEKNESQNVFITECMSYVLSHGFERFGRFFEIGVNYTKKISNPIFRNKKLIIKQLKLLKSSYFKDSERLLIKNIIDYIMWSNKNKNKTILITKNFENYWESMVQAYINSNLYNIESSGELIFKNNCKRYKFKKKSEYIESKKVIESRLSRNYSVEYDHLYLTLDKTAYLFDSKYYKDVKNLDYKQMSYYFILKSSKNYINKKVINGLILPTERGYHYKVHLDTRDREGLLEDLFIVEHYLNVKEVIESFVKRN